MNRTGLPKELKQMKPANMNKGEARFFMYDRFMLVLWKDKRIVSAVSSVYGATFVENERYLKSERKYVKFDKPSMIHHYNSNMHAVDRADQNLSYYDPSRKANK